MASTKSNYQNNLKELYFSNNKALDSTNKKYSPTYIKNTNDILKNVINNNQNYEKVRDRYKISKLLEKILLKTHLNWLTYAYYKNKTLIIYVKDHIAQNEFNYQKNNILNQFKKIDTYNDIEKVSILRDAQKITFPYIEWKTEENVEKSYAIFDNLVTNQKHFIQIEKIRNLIKKHSALINL